MECGIKKTGELDCVYDRVSRFPHARTFASTLGNYRTWIRSVFHFVELSALVAHFCRLLGTFWDFSHFNRLSHFAKKTVFVMLPELLQTLPAASRSDPPPWTFDNAFASSAACASFACLFHSLIALRFSLASARFFGPLFRSLAAAALWWDLRSVLK